MFTDDVRDELLTLLHEDLDKEKHLLWTVKEQIEKQDVSNYPIFVASKDLLALGKMVLDKEEKELHHYFYASHLEEFAVKSIIAEDKIDEFRLVYRDHLDEFCIFLIVDGAGEFIFLPQ